MDVSPDTTSPLAYRRKEVVCSRSWEERFGTTYSWPRVLHGTPCSFVELGPAARDGNVARGNFQLPDLRNEVVGLNVEMFCSTFTLANGIWRRFGSAFLHPSEGESK
jgi:hypothetical protein